MEKSLKKAQEAVEPATRGLSRLMAILLWVVAFLGGIGAVGSPLMHFYYESEKAAALAAGPPPTVAIEDVPSGDNLGAYGEVSIRVQAAPAQVRERPSGFTRWILPLHAARATSTTGRPIAWLAHKDAPWTTETLAQAVQGRGPAGFLLEINGRRVDAKHHFGAVQAALGQFDETAVVIEPFLDGREAALRPTPFDWTTWLIFVAAVVGCAVYGAVQWRKGKKA